jgi:uncharacterized protein (TIGR02271 family)
MNEETIVAIFDRPEQADDAVRDLIAAEVPESAISRHDRAARGSAATDEGTDIEPPREGGFWSRLFGGERDYDPAVYDRSVEAGSTVISVRVSGGQVTLVSEILERHHPIDIDERASGYGLARAPSDGAAGVPPVGYAETQYDAPVPRAAEIGTAADPRAAGSAYQTTGSDLANSTALAPTGLDPTPVGAEASDTLRLAEERLTIGKRLVNLGGTRVRRYVVETPVEEQVTLHEEHVTVDRRPVTGTVAADAADFTDRTIEMAETREEAVVSKAAYVTEEVRLRRESIDRVETLRDTVRREEVEVETLPDETAAGTRR